MDIAQVDGLRGQHTLGGQQFDQFLGSRLTLICTDRYFRLDTGTIVRMAGLQQFHLLIQCQ